MNEFNCDLHFHGLYAGGVSKNMHIPIIAQEAPKKGLHVVTTGDITHPLWLQEVRENVVETSNGVYKSKEFDTYFVVGTELESEGRVHHVVLLPDLNAAEALRESLKGFGNLDSFGCARPKLRLSGQQVAEKVLDVGGIIGPSHAFTPYFGVYAHHDSLRGLYGEELWKKIPFIELGLSADSYWADLMEENHRYAFLTASDSHCVHPESLVTLADGRLIPIEKLWGMQETISCFDFEKKEPSVATYKIMRKEAPKFLLEIEAYTKKIKVTPEHRFFVLHENNLIVEKYASELREGGWIAISNSCGFFEREIPIAAPHLTQYFKLDAPALEKIKKRRNGFKITQKQMESKLGLKNDYYWRLEKGQYKMNQSVFTNMLQILRLNENEISAENTTYLRFPTKLNDSKLCELLGYMIGDGCHEKGKNGDQLSLTDKNRELLEYYSSIAKELFDEDRKVSGKDKRKNSFRLRFSQNILKFFEAIDSHILATSKIREVPEKVFFLGRKHTAAFMRGYFDAEGCVGHHHVDACSSNKLLLMQIQSLLLKFGINSSIYCNYEKTKKKYRYRLHIYGQENLARFQNEINFNHQIKREKIKQILSRLTRKPKHTYLKISNNILWAKISRKTEVKS